jgi:SGNH domain (fused to AT3 domains)
VIPAPEEALLTPNAPCALIEPVLNMCSFAVPASPGDPEAALVGNSHAGHWRAALAVAEDALGWHGISITLPGCPFMLATIEVPEPLRRECTSWVQGVVSWFWSHPQVETLFTAAQPIPIRTSPGQAQVASAVVAYVALWTELPPSVKHIVVIRDNPWNRGLVLACVQSAIERHENAGRRCAEPRREALKTDPAAIAAHQLASPRVQVIDMTRFFCDRSWCYPVIGGALVYRDATHLTRMFSVSLGPYLLREVRRLMAGWNEG